MLRSWKINLILLLLLFAILLGRNRAVAAEGKIRPEPISHISGFYSELRSLVLRHSPDVLLAEAKLKEKNASKWTSWTKLAPRLDLVLEQSTAKDYSILTGGTLGDFANQFTPQEATLSSYRIVAQMPLYNRGAWIGVSSAKIDSDLAENEFEVATSQVDWNLRQRFGKYLLVSYQEAANNLSMDLARTSLQESQLRYQLGHQTLVDVYRAQAKLSQLESERVSVQADKLDALSDLLDYSGLESKDLETLGLKIFLGSEEKIGAVIDEFFSTVQDVEDLKSLPSDDISLKSYLSNNSLVLKKIDLEARLVSARAGTLTASQWPDVELRGSVGKQSREWSTTLSGDQASYSFGVSLNIPLFAFGQRVSLSKEASTLIYQQEVRKKRAQTKLFNDVRHLIIKGQALTKSIESLRFSVEKNKEVESLTRKSYQLGKANFLDLQTSQTSLVDSKVALAKARLELAVVNWQIKWNLGWKSSTQVNRGVQE